MNLPLHRLEVVKERTETTTAFKHHGAKAPVVHSNCVWLIFKQFRRLHRESGAFTQDTHQQLPTLSPFVKIFVYTCFFTFRDNEKECANITSTETT